MKKTFFVLAAAIICSQLNAQQPTDSSLLNEVVVTANKYPNKTSLTGKVVTVISREQIEQSGGRDLSQLLAEQSGIFIAGANSNPGKDKSLYVRGARIEHTLITIDGVPVYDPSGIGGNFDLRNLPLNNIERIEILKGSQSTLYGSDALAAVINIITRKNPAKPITGQLMAAYGSFNSIKTNAGISGRKGKLEYQAGWTLHDTRGINETVHSNNNNPVTDRDGFRQQGVQAGLGYRPNEKLLIQPFIRISSINGDIDQGAFTDELDYTYTQKSLQAGIRNEWLLGKNKLTVLYSYNRISREYTDDSVKSRNGFDTWSQGDYKGSEHFADAYITVKSGSSITLTGGLDYRSSLSDQNYSSIGFFGPYKTTYSRDSLTQNQLGIYVALNWNHPSGFNTEIGGRVNLHSEYGSHAVFNVNPSYLLSRKFKIFANFSSAYRTPSLYQLFSEYGNRDLKPEAATSLEGGLQYYAANNQFSSRVVFYSRNVKDIIFFSYNPVTYVSQYINQDRQKDHGLEWEASYLLSKGITVKAFYNYVTGAIYTRIGNKDTSYNNLLRRPQSAGGINLSAVINPRFYVSSNLSISGERKDAYYDNNSFSTVYTTLGAYALWDIYAEYNFCKKKLKLFADIRNITGSRYTEISGFSTPGTNGFGGIRYNF